MSPDDRRHLAARSRIGSSALHREWKPFSTPWQARNRAGIGMLESAKSLIPPDFSAAGRRAQPHHAANLADR